MLFDGALTGGRTEADPQTIRMTLFDQDRRAGRDVSTELAKHPGRYLECLFFAENLGPLEDAIDLYGPASARRLVISSITPSAAEDDLPQLDLAFRFELPLADPAMSAQAVKALADHAGGAFGDGVAVYWKCTDSRDAIPLDLWQHRLLAPKS